MAKVMTLEEAEAQARKLLATRTGASSSSSSSARTDNKACDEPATPQIPQRKPLLGVVYDKIFGEDDPLDEGEIIDDGDPSQDFVEGEDDGTEDEEEEEEDHELDDEEDEDEEVSEVRQSSNQAPQAREFVRPAAAMPPTRPAAQAAPPPAARAPAGPPRPAARVPLSRKRVGDKKVIEPNSDEDDTEEDKGKIGNEESKGLRQRKDNRRRKKKASSNRRDYYPEGYEEPEARMDLWGMDGCALFCFFSIIVNGIVFSTLYCAVYARDRNFFAPLHQEGFFNVIR